MIANKKLWCSAGALVLAHIVVLGAGFFAPYDPTEQNRDFAFAPPMRVHFVDTAGRFHLQPFVYQYISRNVHGRREGYDENRSRIWPLRFLVCEEPGDHRRILGWSCHFFAVDAPGRVFLLGTDDYGRDQLSRFLYGGQISLFAGLLAATLSLGLGILMGGAAGYFGGWLDSVLMRGTEIFLALPWIYLLFAIRAFLPLQVGARQSFFLLLGVIGLTGWARPARLIRGIVLSSKQCDYVRAARGFGASSAYILRRHILPETAAVALTQAGILVPQYILAEVTLSFLGLGVAEPEPSWGNMLASLQKYYALESGWWMFSVGLALVLIFLLYHSLADALQNRLASVAA